MRTPANRAPVKVSGWVVPALVVVCAAAGVGSPSSQSTLLILRTITNSSRFVPQVP